MKAKVKATGEIIEVKPEMDGFFIDEENANPYKFEDLEFVDTPEQQSGMIQGLFGSLLNPMGGFDKMMDAQFWVGKHSECIFKLLGMLKDEHPYFADRLHVALSYAREIMAELKSFNDGKSKN